MTPSRFQTIEEIFLAALQQEPDQVNAFLDTACAGDAVLRREVEALLASDQRAGRFIETSSVGLATKVIQNQHADSLVGRTIGHYKISESIGTGGMGEVYLATDITAGRKAALKLLPFRFTGDAERLKRFQQEAHAVVGLNHPNILTVYEIGEDHSIHYIASELIEGETLRDHLERGPMQLSEALEVAIQVASALAVAHQAGIVHRDIKPENIMLRPDGYAKVLDFGIAKLAEQELPTSMPKDHALLLVETNLGSVLGTVRYMSPEQARGGHVDKTTDIWSLGVVLYEMVTGHAPFSGDTPKEVMASILEKEPPPVTRYVARAPAELQQIVSKTLRKDPAQRYRNAHELLHALKELRRKLEFKLQRAAAPLWLRWARSPIALLLVLLAAALALTFPFFRHGNLPTSLPPDKSIAVLPLQNLSEDKENAFFADDVQDELLSNLSKIKDLKVISRTSVMQYKSGITRNLKEIGQQLGVSNIVEGSVGRSGDHVRVSVQLIDARTDTHLWAEHYDRDATDVFAIEAEIAQQISDQLQAKLSPAEKAAIAERPTADPVAYAYYTEAKAIGDVGDWEGWDKSGNRKVELLEKATQRDPNFALAYCELAKAQIDLVHVTEEPENREHLELGKNFELAKKAAEAAVRLRPDLGETHLALGRYYFEAGVFTNDYDRAHEELTTARRKLPNNAEALAIEARIGRHQNRWDASLADLQKASALDPRNGDIAFYLWQTYFEMRRYSECEQLITKSVASGRPDLLNKHLLAMVKLAEGEPVAAQSVLEQVPLDFSPHAYIWGTRFTAALYLRDYDAANRVIAATPAKWADFAFGEQASGWAEGQVARARGDKQKALTAFAAARKKMEEKFADIPKDAIYLSEVATLDAGLGRKEEAIREARRAVDLLPIAKESLNGPTLVANLAVVYAWTGERERALEQLEIVATIAGEGVPTYGDLRFNPYWDDLRGDKRFDKIVAAAKAASK
jgi:serine/threonine protein kinase